jgi:hypothetical protein
MEGTLQVKAVRMPRARTAAQDELVGAVKALVAAYGHQVEGRMRGRYLRKNTRYWNPPGQAPLDIDRLVDKLPAQARFAEDVQDALIRVTNRLIDEHIARWGGEATRRHLRIEVERQVVGPLKGHAVEGFGKFTDTLFKSLTDTDIEGATTEDMVRVIGETTEEKGLSWAETAGKFLAAGVVEPTMVTFATLNSEAIDLVKVWHTFDDDKVRPTHWAVEGEVVGATEKFRVGSHLMNGPHDPTAPIEERAGCRCFLEWRPRREGDPRGTAPRPRRQHAGAQA